MSTGRRDAEPEAAVSIRGACMIRLKDVEMEYENGTRAIRGITGVTFVHAEKEG